ncbi:MAG: ABC transporter permease subunit [Verrucomicrobiaceae bacterium]|nr:ABC transporter permease subunit [Verrucomicrobiaceae bacterium]NCF91009.1 ABC transporter permease subunit [Verrucomicrobiaceae bacterium]
MNSTARHIWTITKKELRSYFSTPLAWVLIVVFLLLSQGFAFMFGGLLEYQNASLAAFFLYIPWIFMVFAPAVGMRLWSEEHRLGTMELLMTMPISPWHAIVGKFLAASVIIFISLLLTFPAWITINWLGDPDNGIVFAGYIAAFLVGITFLAVTGVISALTRSMVVSFIVALFICMGMIMSGWPNIVSELDNWIGGLGQKVSQLSVLTHYNELTKGIVVSTDIIFFLSVIGFCLYLTAVILKTKRA